MILADLVTTYHLCNRFLSTEAGALFKHVVEGIVLFLLWYMVTSEYGRDPGKQLRLLMFGFATLFLNAAAGAVAHALALFAGNHTLVPVVVQGGDAVELVGIVLLTNAFLLPVVPWERVRRKTFIELGMVGGLAAGLIATQLLFPASRLGVLAGFEVVKIAVLAQAIVLLTKERAAYGRYGRLARIAFAIYLVTPLVHLNNILLFGYTASRLRVLAQPFPIFAVLLLFRVVYLKLVDKVALRERLAETTRKYEHEREVSKLKDEFVDIVSHELRTPLTSILLYTGLLEKSLMKMEAESRATQMLGIIRRETKRLGALINDILDLSKLEKGSLKLRRKRVDLRALVEQAALPSLALDRGVLVKNSIPEGFSVMVDPDRFAQIVVNLYSNAVKFTPESGIVEFSAERRKNGFVFHVRDTGIGIPPEELARLFDKFYQAGNHLTRAAGGTGLGLAIVKSLAQLHGGDVTVSSEPGKGAVFSVFIPTRGVRKRRRRKKGKS